MISNRTCERRQQGFCGRAWGGLLNMNGRNHEARVCMLSSPVILDASSSASSPAILPKKLASRASNGFQRNCAQDPNLPHLTKTLLSSTPFYLSVLFSPYVMFQPGFSVPALLITLSLKWSFPCLCTNCLEFPRQYHLWLTNLFCI